MNINKVKDTIIALKGCKVRVKIYLGRNKYEYVDGIVEKTHHNIFTINTGSVTKSFTYTDVLIKNVIISKI